LVSAVVLSVAAAVDNVLPGDRAFARFVQDAPQPPAGWLADFGNWIGSGRIGSVISAGAIVALVVARRHWDAAILLLAALARFLNGPLKELIESPRPTPDLVRVTEIRETFGFPSGHAMGSILGFGAIAIVATRFLHDRAAQRVAQIACAIVILLVGFGRIYSGAHWPTDVLGGFLWGATLLWTIDFAVDRFRHTHEVRARAG
jgi:undecaprenyl-diphosphatase